MYTPLPKKALEIAALNIHTTMMCEKSNLSCRFLLQDDNTPPPHTHTHSFLWSIMLCQHQALRPRSHRSIRYPVFAIRYTICSPPQTTFKWCSVEVAESHLWRRTKLSEYRIAYTSMWTRPYGNFSPGEHCKALLGLSKSRSARKAFQ